MAVFSVVFAALCGWALAVQLGDISLRTEIDAAGWDQWVFCADQWMQCKCPGAVRWGAAGHWKLLAKVNKTVSCKTDDWGDPDPGNAHKHCQCAVSRASKSWFLLSPAVVPEADSSKPIVSCPLISSERQRSTPWGQKLWEASAGFCGSEAPEDHGAIVLPRAGPKSLNHKDLQGLLDAWLDPRFERNYQDVYKEDGWVDKAFVNYVGNCVAGGRYDRMMVQLIKSVHSFSKAPIVVVHFGMLAPPSWDPQTFPRLVLLHARPLPKVGAYRSFNFNKYRSMLVARARVGIQLDADEFIAPGADRMFDRTAEEVTEDYPMPILPVHFLVDKGPKDGGVWWSRFCKSRDHCPLQTMRWGHAHPTWSFYALPWLGKWLRRNMRDEVLPSRSGFANSELRVQHVPEDEDLLNVGLWEDKATKQWCKFETPGPEDFHMLLEHRTGAHIGNDPRFYPDGAPLVFLSAHHTVDPAFSAGVIDQLEKQQKDGTLPPPISYKGKFYQNQSALLADHPEVPCLV